MHDLNRTPTLPFEDESFDVVLNTVSVDYLTRPFEVFAEVGGVLRPGGLFLVTFSNRAFPQKADGDPIVIVGSSITQSWQVPGSKKAFARKRFAQTRAALKV